MMTRGRPSRLIGIVLILLSVALTACTSHVLALDCIGASGYCGPVAPTPNPTVVTASAQKITAGTPLLTDPLTKQSTNDWATTGGCGFHNGVYVAKNTNNLTGTLNCHAQKNLQYKDAAFAMDVTLLSGAAAGMAFRVSTQTSSYYEFSVGKDDFVLAVFQHGRLANVIINPLAGKVVVHGLNQVNHLLAITRGNDIQLFVNGEFGGEVRDNSITTGGTVGAVLEYDKHSEAHFANLAIYPV